MPDLHGQLTWSDYHPEDIYEDIRQKNRIVLLTFPPASDSLGLEPSILSVAPKGDNVEYCYNNHDFDDDDVKLYLCSVYISGMLEFEEWARRHDFNKIVVGGYHPTTFPDEFKRLAHKVVRGPCDDIYATIEQEGQLVPGIVNHQYLPRRDVYDLRSWNKQIIPDCIPDDICVSINTSQGCSQNPPCEFCASAIMCNKVLSKPLEYVEKEAHHLAYCGADFCFIRDENFFMQKDWEERLKIIQKSLHNSCSVSEYPSLYLFASANTLNKKKVEVMKKCGVYMVCLGLEDPTKEYTKNKNLDNACKMLHEAGIYVYLSFIVNPLKIVGAQAGKDFYVALHKRFEELKPEMVCGNFLMPFPGTKLWDKYYHLVDRSDYPYYDSKTPFLVRNKVVRDKMKFFMFWHQWQYYQSDLYNEEIRHFRCRDTLHLRFLELEHQFREMYEALWKARP